MKQHLFKEDKQALHGFQAKNIETQSLEEVFSKINENEHFNRKEKDYLKRILIDNINHAYQRTHPQDK